MKAFTYVFWAAVAGIGITFGMSVYTAIATKKAESEQPRTIPTPAMPAPASS